MRHLETTAAKAKPVPRSEAAANARTSTEAPRLPLLLDNGVSVLGYALHCAKPWYPHIHLPMCPVPVF